MTSLVSIIIPCHNASRFLEATLQSALAQTWPETEIIVVDDHSTDDSSDLAGRYVSPKVKLVASTSRGAAAARNRGLQEARGEFLQFLDADDLLSSDKIAAQVEVLRAAPPGCVALCATTHFRDGSDPLQGHREDGWPLIDSDDPAGWLVELSGPDGRAGMVHPAAWLTPRSVAASAGPWNEALSLDDDGEYFCRVVLASAGLRRSPTGRSFYRKFPPGAHNLSAQSSDAHQRSGLLSLDLRAEKILARDNSDRAKRGLAHRYQEFAFQAFSVSPAVSEEASQRSRKLDSTEVFSRLWKLERPRFDKTFRLESHAASAYRLPPAETPFPTLAEPDLTKAAPHAACA